MVPRLRTVAAALTAPPVGVAAAYLLVVVLLDLSADIGLSGLARFFLNFMTVGSAVAYAVELVVGIPAAMLLKRRSRLTFLATVAVGVLGGVIAFLPVLRVMTGSTSAFTGTMLVGAASGACAGVWFWVVASLGRHATQDGEGPEVEVEQEPSTP
jgi:hypothetical protein